jgi:hypothetical protein
MKKLVMDSTSSRNAKKLDKVSDPFINFGSRASDKQIGKNHFRRFFQRSEVLAKISPERSIGITVVP